MEDEEGYTALNLRPSAAVPRYSSSHQGCALKAPARCAPADRSSASSPGWRLATFALLALCLLLLTGLLALGALVSQVPRDPEEGKKLQELREALCLEVKEKNEQSALPPGKQQVTLFWSKSSLLWVQSLQTWKLEELKSCFGTVVVMMFSFLQVSLPQDSRFYWVGLSYISERSGWYWEDGTAFSRELTNWVVFYDNILCASYYGRILYASNSCATKQFCICEKVAVHF
ncbi:KLRE1 protein, partial [Bucco capensis]|nr:KLRE1 protein [Bucco capensis]